MKSTRMELSLVVAKTQPSVITSYDHYVIEVSDLGIFGFPAILCLITKVTGIVQFVMNANYFSTTNFNLIEKNLICGP